MDRVNTQKPSVFIICIFCHILYSLYKVIRGERKKLVPIIIWIIIRKKLMIQMVFLVREISNYTFRFSMNSSIFYTTKIYKNYKVNKRD